MKSIKLCDCTLHEGGYRNNWMFCKDQISLHGFLGELALIQTDIMDIGVLDNEKKSQGCYYNKFNEILIPPIGLKTKYAVTILKYKKFELESVEKIAGIEYVRIIVTTDAAFVQLEEMCKCLKSYGYKIIVDVECEIKDTIHSLNELVERLTELDIDAIVIDDVYGSIDNQTLFELFMTLNDNLENHIGIGYRGRNYANNVQDIVNKLIEYMGEREFLIEASLMGISRNISLPELEMMVSLLNVNYNTTYDISRIYLLIENLFKSVNYTSEWKTDFLSPIIAGVDTEYKSIGKDMHITNGEMSYILKHLSPEEKEKFNIQKCYLLVQKYRESLYKSNLAIVVWIDEGGEELVEKYLDMEIANIAQTKIDVYFCNISPNKSKSEAVQKYEKFDVENIHYLENNSGMINVLKSLLNKYKYIWMNQSEYVIKYSKIDFYLPSLLDKGYDIIVAENDWEKSGRKGLYEYKECEKMFLDNFIKLYSMGTVLYSTEFLKAVFETDVNEQIDNEMVLTQKVYEYIAYNSRKYANYYADFYSFDPYNSLFGIDNYVEKWSVRLETLVNYLPDQYDKYKDVVLKERKLDYNPFSKYRITYLNAQKRKEIKEASKYINRKYQFLFKIPSWMCKVMIREQNSKIGKLVNKIVKRKKREKENFPIDFAKYVNCIVPQEKVASQLIYGDLNYISNPWLTIVIPTYKRADLLEEAIHSILCQDEIEHPWDIVIVDNEEVTDGEENETEKIIKKINNPRILYYRNKENLGVAGNYNRGIELARGKWISLLHSDDLLVQGYLSRISKILDVYSKKLGKEIGYISSGYESFFSECLSADRQWSTEIKRRNFNISERQKGRSAVLIRVRRAEFMITGAVGISLPSNGTIMNRKAILESGGFNDDLGICADMVLPLKLMKNYAVYRTDEVMGHYRVGRTNISASSDNSYKVEKNYYDIREYYYRQSFFGRIMGFLFRQQHFFMIDNILGKPYFKDETLHTIYQYKEQHLRDRMFFGYFGLLNQFYWIQKKMSMIKGAIMTKLFWNE